MKPHSFTGTTIWIMWFLSSLVGSVAGLIIAVFAYGVLPSVLFFRGGVGISGLWIFIVQVVAYVTIPQMIFGWILTTTQWLVMRKFTRKSKGWFVASAIGYFWASLTMLFSPHYPFAGLVAGCILGFSQWFALRKIFHQAKSWILVNTLSIGLGGVIWSLSDGVSRMQVTGFTTIPISYLLQFLAILFYATTTTAILVKVMKPRLTPLR
jgi:hypothetical protein